LEDIQNLQAWNRCLEAGVFQSIGAVHGGRSSTHQEKACRYNGLTLLSAMSMTPPMRCALCLVALLVSAVFLSGCQTAISLADQTASAVKPYIKPLVTPYKIDVVQGNVVTREQLATLQVGMSRAQVSGALGTSLLVNVFHADRWDYVFSFKRKGGAMESRRVTLWFEADKVARIEADELPSEAEFVAGLKGVREPGPLPVLEATPEQLQRFPAPARASAASAPRFIPSSYPPLEAPSPQ
jgi:outer membrane protein assembly factor BamE